MSAHRGTETTFELTTIERLERVGYDHRHGEEIVRPHDEVVLKDLVRARQRSHAALPDVLLPRLLSGELRVMDGANLVETA